MNYYLITANQDLFQDFQNRMPALRNAVLIENENQLAKELEKVPGNTFFFIHFLGLNEEIDEWVLQIKEKAPHAKVLYITEDNNAHDLKAHQLTPVGGDAYIHSKISEKDFNDMLESLKAPEIVNVHNRLENQARSEFSDFGALIEMKNHPKSIEIDELFKSVIKTASKKPNWQSFDALSPTPSEEEGESVAIKEQELSLEGEELEINLDDESTPSNEAPVDEGMELNLDADESFELGEVEMRETREEDADQFGDLSLDDDSEEELSLSDDDGEELSLSEDFEDTEEEADLSLDEGAIENLGELSFEGDDGLSLSLDDDEAESLDFSASSNEGEDSLSLDLSEDADGLSVSDQSLSFETDRDLELSPGEMDLSEDAKEKLKEIDAILDYDASQVQIRNDLVKQENLDEPLVSDDLDLESLSFDTEEVTDHGTVEIEPEVPVKEEKVKKKKKETPEKNRDLGSDLHEISSAYSGEMERMQATISNLRADREELLAKIQSFEEDKMLQGRQFLSLRAELDERKIELTIIRRKLNEEINELKDKVKLFDEKRLILEEKNRILAQELDKAGQKNKIDVKKVQMRERELEQKLELLKSDAETQIRNRDRKILELKRKIDAMEFDMESISLQEKRSVESRFELEDKLDKAIKTLRSAITVLEDESDHTSALDALKKNIDM